MSEVMDARVRIAYLESILAELASAISMSFATGRGEAQLSRLPND
jgi:hypothetical protein